MGGVQAKMWQLPVVSPKLVDAGVITFFALLCLYFLEARIVGRIIEAFIEALDDKLFGVQVEIESMTFSLCRGRLEINRLRMDNPPGYKTKYALKIGRLVFDVDTCSLLCSICKKKKLVRIESIEVENVNINMELYDGMPTNSNDTIKSNISDLLQWAPSWREATEDSERDQLVAEDNETLVHVQRLLVKEIHGKLTHRILQGFGFKLALADMDFDDFSSDHGGDTSMLGFLMFLSQMLLTSVMKSLLVNLFTRHLVLMPTVKPRRCCDD